MLKTTENKSKISASMLNRTCLEIAQDRPLWALIMLNSYDNSPLTKALRSLAIKKIDKWQYDSLSTEIVKEIVNGRALSDFSYEHSESIKICEIAARIRATRINRKIWEERNLLFLQHLKNKMDGTIFSATRSIRRDRIVRNRLINRLYKGVKSSPSGAKIPNELAARKIVDASKRFKPFS